MSADHKPETTSPMLWTLALLGFTAVTLIWISYWLNQGYTHGRISARTGGSESAASGPEVPDHKKLIETMNEDVLARGEKLFNAYCASCHGAEGNGSTLSPTARKFALEPFQNDVHGAKSHPWTMYETITNGFKQMTAQKLIIPKADDRYAVIHYIRETFVKPKNAEQYVKIEDALANAEFPAPQTGSADTGPSGPHPQTLPIGIPVYAVLEQASAAAAADKNLQESLWLVALDTQHADASLRPALESIKTLAGHAALARALALAHAQR
jgi:mono/diheme cytochrome c family protein